jgi:hypothetical protein
VDEPKYPDYIQERITNEFLTTFKEELENIFTKEKPDKPTYWNYYQWFDSTQGFETALKNACEIHNFMELYDYLQSLEWYDSDILDSELTELLYKRKLVKKGSPNQMYRHGLMGRLYTNISYYIKCLLRVGKGEG